MNRNEAIFNERISNNQYIVAVSKYVHPAEPVVVQFRDGTAKSVLPCGVGDVTPQGVPPEEPSTIATISLEDSSLTIKRIGMEEVPKNKRNDDLNEARAKGYILIQIYDDEWEKNWDLIRARIASKLQMNMRIGARECTVYPIEYIPAFLEKNNLMGKGSSTSINLGLMCGNILVGVMGFSKARFNKSYTYELVRFCTLKNLTVVGGASKLFKYFREHYKGSVISYANRRWCADDALMYGHLGFTYSHSSPPGYFYYNGSKKLSRYQCQKHKLQVLFPELFTHEKTEKEIMKEAGYYRCYDCGNDVYVIE